MDLELECLVDFAGTADWRRSVARRHPEDIRNLQAAETLERLGAEARKLEGSEAHSRLLQKWLNADDPDDPDGPSFRESVSELLRSVGFGFQPVDAQSFVDRLLQEL